MIGSDATNTELETQEAFERRWNKAEIAILVGLGLVILGGLGGLLGDGLVANATRESPDGAVSIRYEWIVRRTATARTTVTVSNPGSLEIELSRPFAVDVSNTVPHAAEVRAGPDSVTYVFAQERGAARTSVMLETKPTTAGISQAWVRISGQTLRFHQVVLP